MPAMTCSPVSAGPKSAMATSPGRRPASASVPRKGASVRALAAATIASHSHSGSSSQTSHLLDLGAERRPACRRRARHAATISPSTSAKPRVGDHATRSGAPSSLDAARSTASRARAASAGRSGRDRRSASSAGSGVGELPGEHALGREVGPPRRVRRRRQGTRPSDGLSPVRPHSAAGMRIEPPPSDAVASGTRPAATAAAEPPEEPPAERARSHGLPVAPPQAFTVSPFHACSGRLVLPTDDAAGGPQPGHDDGVALSPAGRRGAAPSRAW